MKKNLLLIAMLMLSIVTFAKGEKETVVFDVAMSCNKCVAKIEQNIAYEKGVTDLKCNLDKQIVAVEYRTDKTNIENLKQGFKKIGFEATEKKTTEVKKSCCSTKSEACK